MLNPLRYLVEVARCKSISIAAKNVNVAPSAISRHIRNIEQEYGILLFERNARGVTLTPAGEIYVRYAKAALLDKDHVKVDIDELKGLQSGRVRICTMHGIVSTILCDAVTSFTKINPGVKIDLVSTSSQLVTKTVREGEADIGITSQPASDPRVETIIRYANPLCLLVSPEHPLAQVTEIDFVDALKYPLALPEASFGIRNIIDAYCRDEQISVSPILETNSIEALRGFSHSGAGVSIINLLSVSRDLDLGLAVAIPFRNAAFHKSVVEIRTPKRKQQPIAVERFIHHLKKSFSAIQEHGYLAAASSLNIPSE